MLKQKDKYKEPITFTFPKVVARVYIPILDSSEREKRMKNIHRATANLFKGVEK
jgi:hypothetical protein